MLDFVTRFKSYKPYNNFLVYMQNPSCEYFATTKHWKEKFSRQPKVDARPMVILAPMHPVLFVYDLDDTEGKEIPELLRNPFEVAGYFDDGYFSNLLSYFPSLGITLHQKQFDLRRGGSIYRPSKSAPPEIEINSKNSSAVNFGTVVHELAHLFLGHLGSLENEKYPEREKEILKGQDLQEMEAESVTYLVLSRFSLETKSDEYLAFYGAKPSDLKRISMDLVLKVTAKIEDMSVAPYRAPASK